MLENIYIQSGANVKTITQGFKKHQKTSKNENNKLILDFVNDLSGNSLKGFFDEGMLDSLQLEGMAKTHYHIFEDSIYQGENIASGDTIILQFYQKDILSLIHI